MDKWKTHWRAPDHTYDTFCGQNASMVDIAEGPLGPNAKQATCKRCQAGARRLAQQWVEWSARHRHSAGVGP